MLDIVMHNVIIFLLVNAPLSPCERRAAIRLAAHRKYTVRQIRQKTPVALLCEWKNLRAERLNCLEDFQQVNGICIKSCPEDCQEPAEFLHEKNLQELSDICDPSVQNQSHVAENIN